MEFILETICLKKIKDRAYVINFDEHADAGTHWIDLYVSNNEIIYFESFEVENVPKEIEIFIEKKKQKTKRNIFRIQSQNSIMCGYFCIGLIDFVFADIIFIDYTSFFSPYNFKNNDNIILSYFKNDLMKYH